MFCQQCGTENNDNAKFCFKCGAPLHVVCVTDQSQLNQQQETIVTNTQKISYDKDQDTKLLEAFIGKPEKVDFYAKAFKKFDIEGKKWHWSWWAAFMNIPFLFHRKIYIPAILLTVFFVSVSNVVLYKISTNPYLIITNPLLANLPSLLSIVVFILLGGYGINLVYNNFVKLKNEISMQIPDSIQQVQEMQKRGGYVDVWKLILGYILFMCLYFGEIYYYTISKIDIHSSTESVLAEEEKYSTDEKLQYDDYDYGGE